MNELGKVYQLIIPFMGHKIILNIDVIIMTLIVFMILIVFGYFASRKKLLFPNSIQLAGEMFITQIYNLTDDALGEKLSKQFAPLICALFMFLLVSNWVCIIPHLEEPTKDLNTTLSLGIMGFIIAHYCGIREKGFKNYISAYFEPIFFMMPLNLIGELAKVISISFRLFGNIMGGSIIILVVSYLTYSVILPPVLNIFFGIFVGSIQAFVFTMLTVVYISVQVK